MRRLRLWLLALISFASLATFAAGAAEITFVRVWPGWRDTESFDRISEYFTNEEHTSGEVLLRTHPDTRAGLYYLVRVANPTGALANAKFVLQLIPPTAPVTKTYTFPVALTQGQSVFNLGLTGPEWPDRKVHPVAWKLELRGPDDQVLAAAQSFLWEKPAK